MKRLLVVLTLVFMSLNFIACSQKKDSKTRLTKGGSRESAAAATAAGSGWAYLNQYAEEVELYSSNPDAAARAFAGNDDVFVGPSQINSVAMRLRFNGNQVDGNNTMMGLRFYDNGNDPLTYFLGASVGRRAIQGFKNGNQVQVVFDDRNDTGSIGTITVKGYINGSRFNGTIEYNGILLGEFNVTQAYSISN